jgi:hypothetical protein
VLALSMLLGVFVGTSGAGSRASALEPAFVLFGFVTGGKAPLPARVRASINGVVCGSAQVNPVDVNSGAYALAVVAADQKPGCGTNGALVQLSLVLGEIDATPPVAQVLWRAGQSMRFDLSTVTSAPNTGAFLGLLPVDPGIAYLRWSGSSGVPIEVAVATIPRQVTQVDFWNVRRQAFDTWAPGGPSTYTLVDADDIVILHVR